MRRSPLVLMAPETTGLHVGSVGAEGSQEPPRVLLLHEIAGVAGGAERYAELLARGLPECGWSLGAAVFGVDQDSGRRFAGRLASIADSVWFFPGHSDLRRLRAAHRRFRPQVMHWNFSGPFVFRGGTWLLPPWGSPSVVTDHLPLLRGRPYYEVTRRLAHRRTAAMIVVGESSRATAMEHWPRLPPVRVVRNGVPGRNPDVRPRRVQGEPLRLAFVGRLVEQKNPLFAVEVARALQAAGSPFELRVVGSGPLEGVARDLAYQRGLAQSVVFVGHLTDPSAEIARADALLLPSTYESALPFVAMEALGAGTPVLASDIPSHVADAGRSPAFRVLPGDPPQWADAAREAGRAGDPLRAAAVEFARQFSLERMTRETVRVYREVTADHHGG